MTELLRPSRQESRGLLQRWSPPYLAMDKGDTLPWWVQRPKRQVEAPELAEEAVNSKGPVSLCLFRSL